MGRVKTILVKRITHKIMETDRNLIADDFQKNKEVINRLVSVRSKKLRNIIAGYATRLVKKEKNV